MSETIRRKPSWIKFTIPGGETYTRVKKTISENSLNTICLEARCPNIGECFNRGTATFLIMGDTCTRNCLYCSVSQGAPLPADEREPGKIARAISTLGLSYAVITSVTRDDIPDGGAFIFAETVRRIRVHAPQCSIELLVPDFRGSMKESIDTIAATEPEVINHNIEVARSHYRRLRPMGDYDLSLDLIGTAAGKGIPAKSGLMIGFGETMRISVPHSAICGMQGVPCSLWDSTFSRGKTAFR
jgi:lipoic acid synthetase